MEIFEAAELVKLNDGAAGVNNICCQYFLYIVFLRKILGTILENSYLHRCK